MLLLFLHLQAKASDGRSLCQALDGMQQGTTLFHITCVPISSLSIAGSYWLDRPVWKLCWYPLPCFTQHHWHVVHPV